MQKRREIASQIVEEHKQTEPEERREQYTERDSEETKRTLSVLSQIVNRMSLKIGVFGEIFYWAGWVFVGVWLIGLIVCIGKRDSSLCLFLLFMLTSFAFSLFSILLSLVVSVFLFIQFAAVRITFSSPSTIPTMRTKRSKRDKGLLWFYPIFIFLYICKYDLLHLEHRLRFI